MKDRAKALYHSHKTEICVFAIVTAAAISYKFGHNSARAKFEVVNVETFLNETTGDVHVKMWPKNGYATMPKTKPTVYK